MDRSFWASRRNRWGMANKTVGCRGHAEFAETVNALASIPSGKETPPAVSFSSSFVISFSMAFGRGCCRFTACPTMLMVVAGDSLN